MAIYQRCVLLHFCQEGCNTEHVGEINVELHRRRKGRYFSDDVDKKTLTNVSPLISLKSLNGVSEKQIFALYLYHCCFNIRSRWLTCFILHCTFHGGPNSICQTSENHVGSTHPKQPKHFRAAKIVISSTAKSQICVNMNTVKVTVISKCSL